MDFDITNNHTKTFKRFMSKNNFSKVANGLKFFK